MKTSEQINELCAALSKAQGQIVGAKKDSENPFFKSRYADLASCWDACREQLASNGLAVMQFTESGEAPFVAVTTRLTHSSGQWVESLLSVFPKDSSPQAMGSAITYARRYAMAAMVGLAQVDDDGEAAQDRAKTETRYISPAQRDQIQKLLEASGSDARRFCALLRVTSLDSIPAANYEIAVGLINSKKKPEATNGKHASAG